jgi:hypothetical protein
MGSRLTYPRGSRWGSLLLERTVRMSLGADEHDRVPDQPGGAGDCHGDQVAARRAFRFLGYRQTPGTDPAQAERCLDMA